MENFSSNTTLLQLLQAGAKILSITVDVSQDFLGAICNTKI